VKGRGGGSDALLARTIAGRYEVVRLIGKGGMGAVYEVRHTRLNRVFALKTLADELVGSPEALARFRREADIVSRLNHPHIVQVIDWEVLEGGAPCLVMEYLEGETLHRLIKRAGKLPWSTIGKVGDQILSALSVAHKAGVTHRDIKPDNILLALDDSGNTTAKLLDFGVSKVHDSRTIATADQRLLGTPCYMSPEQADGDQLRIDGAADVWAMGAILFEMAAGEQAFQGGSVPSILYKVCHGAPLSIEGRRDDAPTSFRRLVADALSRDPDRRLRKADMMRARLRAALEGMPDVSFPETLDLDLVAPASEPMVADEMAATVSSGPDESAAGRQPPAPRRSRRWVALAAVTALAAGGFAVFNWRAALGIGGRDEAAPDQAAAVPSPPVAPPAAALAPADEVASAPTAATPVAASPPAPAAATVRVEVSSEPAGATVYRAADGVKLGQTPFSGEFQRGPGVAELLLVLPGHANARIEVPIDADSRRTVALVAVARARGKKERAAERSRNRRSGARAPAGESAPAAGSKTPAVDKKPLGDKTVDPFGG